MFDQYFKLLNLYRKEPNYIIKNYKNNSNICYVFFSSQGIYNKPYDIEGMKNVFENKRYEWERIALNKKIVRNCCKQIFIRDIGKELYQRGINEQINSIDKLIKFISDETEDMDVYLVGSSSGGYIAFIASQLHNVKRVYSVGGLVNIGKLSTYKETINRYHLDAKYIDASTFINLNSWIIHIYGLNNFQDVENTSLLKKQKMKNNVIIPIDSEKHAPRPSGHILINLLTCKDSRLNKLSARLKNKKYISESLLSFCVGCGIRFTINYCKRILIHEKGN